MKKNRIIIAMLCGVLTFSMLGCGEKEQEINIENENTVESSDTQEEVEPGKNIQLTEIGVESATQLVKEKVGDEYKIEYTGSIANGSEEEIKDKENEEDSMKNKYYIFSVSKDKEPLVKEIAVQVISGEIFSYDVEAGVQDYSEFPLYDEKKDEVVSWEGEYSNDKFVVKLVPGDSNSFEFVINNAKGEEIIAAVATIDGRNAIFSSEGYELNFEMRDKKIVMKEKANDKMKFDLDGEYTK